MIEKLNYENEETNNNEKPCRCIKMDIQQF